MSVSSVEVITPPITARPSGARKSAPSPWPIATGTPTAADRLGLGTVTEISLGKLTELHSMNDIHRNECMW